eukprot:2731240-Rhodomonas_salina.8
MTVPSIVGTSCDDTGGCLLIASSSAEKICSFLLSSLCRNSSNTNGGRVLNLPFRIESFGAFWVSNVVLSLLSFVGRDQYTAETRSFLSRREEGGRGGRSVIEEKGRGQVLTLIRVKSGRFG